MNASLHLIRGSVFTQSVTAIALLIGLCTGAESRADRYGNGGNIAFSELYNSIVTQEVKASYPQATTAYEILAQIFDSAEPFRLSNPPVEMSWLVISDYSSSTMNDYLLATQAGSFRLGYRSLSPPDINDLGLPTKQELECPQNLCGQAEVRSDSTVIYVETNATRKETLLRRFRIKKGKKSQDYLIAAVFIFDKGDADTVQKSKIDLYKGGYETVHVPKTGTTMDAAAFLVFRVNP